MFSKNLQHRNSFLRSSCPNFKPHLIDNGISEIFFRHLTPTVGMQQIPIVKECKEFQEKYSRGYGRKRFENLIANLSILNNLDVIASLLEQLNNELTNSSVVPLAIKLGAIERLYIILADITSFTNPIIMPCALKILKNIAMDFKGARAIVANDEIIMLMFTLMREQKDLREMCSEIMLVMSLNDFVADEILKKIFFIPSLKVQFLKFSNSQTFMKALANFIQRQPKSFISSEIVEKLLNNDHPESFKCLSYILNNEEAEWIEEKFKVACKLASILFNCTRDDDEKKTNVVMALRSCLISKKPFCQSGFPWRLLLKLLIDALYTKTNKFLQLNSISTLRIMSDVWIVKKELKKVYKSKLKCVKCLSDEIEEKKQGLLEWLDYKNFKSNKGNKYENCFI